MNDTKVIDLFEETIANYCGSKYGVAISSCTNAIFLSLQYLLQKGELKPGDEVICPSHTFLSVPCQLKLCGLKIKFQDLKWSGCYQLFPTPVWDCATRFGPDIFVGGDALQCLSFQYRKHLKIGRGGMVLTNDLKAREWLKMARINGRHEGVPQDKEELEFCGWNMYLTPEQAGRGLSLFDALPKPPYPDCGSSETYPDISKQKVFK